jgi:hypothetical protein
MRLIDTSQEVWLWGAALTVHIPMLEETLRLGVGRGLKANVLLIAPNSASVRMLAFRAVSPPATLIDPSASLGYKERLDDLAALLNRKLSDNIEALERIKRSIPTEQCSIRL